MNSELDKYFQNTPELKIFYIDMNQREDIISYAKSVHYLVADLSELILSTEREICGAIGKLMDFPSYYGKNWDALIECLGDLDWGEGHEIMGAVVLLDNQRQFSSHGFEFNKLVEVMKFAQESLYSPSDPMAGSSGRMLRIFVVSQ